MILLTEHSIVEDKSDPPRVDWTGRVSLAVRIRRYKMMATFIASSEAELVDFAQKIGSGRGWP